MTGLSLGRKFLLHRFEDQNANINITISIARTASTIRETISREVNATLIEEVV